MPTISKTIGTGGNYTTLADWHNDLDNAAVYAAGDIAEGLLIGTHSITTQTINKGTTIGLSKVRLKKNAAGAKIVASSLTTWLLNIAPGASMEVEIAELEIDGNGKNITSLVANNGAYNSARLTVRHCIIHGLLSAAGTASSALGCIGGRRALFYGNLVYGITHTIAGQQVTGIDCSSTFESKCYNNTVYGVTNSGGGAANTIGINGVNNAVCDIRNNISVGHSGGTVSCYSGWGASATRGYNISSDATATGGSGNQTGVTAASLFVTAGSDFHLKSGSPAIDTGTNLGSPYDIDLDGNTRGTLFDIGSYEYVTAPTGNRRRRVLLGSAA